MFDKLKKILERLDADYGDIRYEIKNEVVISFNGKELTQIGSNYLLRTWLLIDTMLPEELEPIKSGLKRSRTRSKQGTGLTTNFMMFLCTAGILHRYGSMTMGELSNATSIPKSTTTRMINWMVDSKYVERIQDDKDKRIMRVRLTASGLELLLAAKSQLKELANRFLERLPAIQRAALILSMTDLISAWQSVHEKQIAASSQV